MRGATPGTILALVGAILLTLVTLSTPIIKSISFLDVKIENNDGSFGALGYCIGGSCQGPTLGYSFDPNELLGITIVSSKISSSVIKGLTYTLVLHPIALGAAAATVLLGILAHCDGCLAPCFSTCFAGITASLTLIAFGLDLALFVLAKKRIDSVGNGESASYGTALWMTLAAWIIMVVASCAFGCSCFGGGGGGGRRKKRSKDDDFEPSSGGYGARPGKDGYAEQMRMDALAAEQDRKRRQGAYNNRGRAESDLPKFAEYETEHEVAVPLTSNYDDGHHYSGAAAAYQPYQHGYPQQQYHQQNVLAPSVAPPLRQNSAASHVPGVGAGYGRRDNAAGQGAHAGATALHSPGNGPQPYRDPHSSNSHAQAYQEYGNAGHRTEYSGQTFGGDGERRAPSVAPSVQSQMVGQAYSTGQHQQYYSYDQSNAPPMPVRGQQETPYGNRAPSAAPTEVPLSPIRREGTLDDTFGLASLTAGAAAATKQRGDGDEDYRYGNQASSAYGHGGSQYHQSENQHEQPHPSRTRQALPQVPQNSDHQEENYYDESHVTESQGAHSAPPEYDWDAGDSSNPTSGYGSTPFTRSSYPAEKR